MTKAELRAEIKGLLRGIDETRKYTNLFIDSITARCFNNLVLQTFQNDKSRRDLDLYTKSYNVSAIVDDSSGKYYSDISSFHVVPVLDAKHGVRSIHLLQDESLLFYPVTKRTLQLFTGSTSSNTLAFGLTDTMIGYNVTRDKIWYYGMDASVAVNNITINIIVDYTKLDDEDVVHVPAGQDVVLVKMVVEMLFNKPDVELLNDNSDRSNG